MKFMVMVRANKASEAGAMPDETLLADMGRFNEELVKAGVMLAGEGLHPSSKGARVRFSGAKRVVIDGPFAETKELIAGYWLWQVKSLQDAIAWASKAPSDGASVFNLELRPLFEPEDFAEVASPEIIAQEQGWRAEQAKNAPKATA